MSPSQKPRLFAAVTPWRNCSGDQEGRGLLAKLVTPAQVLFFLLGLKGLFVCFTMFGSNEMGKMTRKGSVGDHQACAVSFIETSPLPQ